VEVYARVRRALQVDGMSIREASREFGLARETVRKMMQFSLPPGYQRKKPVRKPKLGPWLGIIDQILEDDQEQRKNQRHTAKRIWQRLRAEHGFTGGYTVVKDYVREARLRQREVFVPLTHPPGDAQADFGEALVSIGRVEQKAHFLCVDLPHSDDSFVMAFPSETTEAFLEGHRQAFDYFDGAPRTMLYDNHVLRGIQTGFRARRDSAIRLRCWHQPPGPARRYRGRESSRAPGPRPVWKARGCRCGWLPGTRY